MEPSSVAFASVSETTVQSDNDDPFPGFEDFCLRISESDISFDSSDKESDKNQDMIDSVKMIEATEGIKCNGDVNTKINNIEQIKNCIDNEISENVQMIDNIEQSDVLDNIKQSEDNKMISEHSEDNQMINEHSEDNQMISEHSEDNQMISEHSEDNQMISEHSEDNQMISEHSEDVENGLDEYDSSMDAPTYDGFALYEDDDEEGKECVINSDEKIVENILESLITQIEYAESIQEDEDRENKLQEERDEITIESNDAEMVENDDSSSDMDIELDSILRDLPDSFIHNSSVKAAKRNVPSDTEIEDTESKKIKNNSVKQKIDDKIEELTNGIQESVAIPGPSKPAEITSSFDKLNSLSKFNIPEANEYIEAAISEWVADTGLVGHERTEYNRLKTEVVTLKAAVSKYQKQYEDVRKLLRKMIEDRKATLENPQILPPPAKVTRSVGLQVCTLGRRNMQLFGSKMPVSTQSSTILPSNLPEKSISPPTPLSRTGQPQNARKSTSMSQLQRRLQSEKLNCDIKSPSSSGSLALPPSSEPQPSTSRMDVVDLTDADEDVIPVSSSQIQIMSSNGEYKAQNSSANATAKTKEAPQAKKAEEVQPTKIRPVPRLPSSPISSSTTRPPIPILRISRSTPTAGNPGSKSGIMLCWNFTNEEYVKIPISKYQVFAYQEGGDIKENWKKVGDVAALPLPMACTLTQFKEGFKYYFAVRAVDKNMTIGEFSTPGSIRLNVSKDS